MWVTTCVPPAPPVPQLHPEHQPDSTQACCSSLGALATHTDQPCVLWMLVHSSSLWLRDYPYWNGLGFSWDRSQQRRQRLMVTKLVKGGAGRNFHARSESKVAPINMWWVKGDALGTSDLSCPQVQESACTPSQALAPGVSVIKVCLREELSGQTLAPRTGSALKIAKVPKTKLVWEMGVGSWGWRAERGRVGGLFVLQVIAFVAATPLRYELG